VSIRALVNRLLEPRGLEIRKRFSHARRHSACVDLMRRSNFRPGTVVDVGVATGTPWLYESFPESKLVLIDPHPGFAADLARLKDQYDADVFAHALGAQEGELVLHVDERVPSSSSLLAVSPELSTGWAERGIARPVHDAVVPVKTLDRTLAAARYSSPYLLKIDTEGYEREVLLGASGTLSKTDVVITETSVMRRFEGSYEFADLIKLLDERGFRLFDLLDVRTFGSGGPISYLDAAFVRRDSELSRGWGHH